MSNTILYTVYIVRRPHVVVSHVVSHVLLLAANLVTAITW